MRNPPLKVEPVDVSRFIYGTAWKEDETQRLVGLALEAGFRGIDTANQRKHYHEAEVGRAIASAIAAGVVQREELFLQTKYTFQAGQDHRLPYDPKASIARQVEQSFANSLEHLQTEYVDSYLLHGPSTRSGLTANDWTAWDSIATIHHSGRARAIGVSNVTREQLQLLVDRSQARPSFVQNRCYASQGWDRGVREFCALHQIAYQGFSLLTANRPVLVHPDVLQIAQQLGISASQLIFRFALDIGIMPLTGTTRLEHMRADLNIGSIEIDAAAIAKLEAIAG